MIDHSVIKGFLKAGVFDAIAEAKPYHVADCQLAPLISIEEIIELTGQVLQTVPNRIQIYAARQLVFSGLHVQGNPNILYELSRPDNINMLRDQSTLVLNALHRDVEKLEMVCFLISLILGSVVQVNAYLGSNGSTGLGPHRDKHEVLVWQQSGEKLWTIEDPAGSELQINMTPGGLLFIPKDLEHSAQTGPEQESLHLTFGFQMFRDEEAMQNYRGVIQRWRGF